MRVRNRRVLLFGACSPPGRTLVEALLSLGAQVVAADPVRTRLEDLRAALGQPERLHVADCEPQELEAASALVADVGRDEPLDVAVVLVPRGNADQLPCALEAVLLRMRRDRSGLAIWVGTGGEPPWLRAEAKRARGAGVELLALSVPEGLDPGDTALARWVVSAIDPGSGLDRRPFQVLPVERRAATP